MYENHDINIAMSSSRADTDHVLGFNITYRHTQTDRALFIPLVTPISSLHTHKGPYKYYVIRDGVGGGKEKDNTLITCPGQEGGGGR